MFIPLSSLQNEITKSSFYIGKKVYFICHSGGRSRMACNIFEKLTHQKAFNVSGGVVAWEKASYELIQN